VSGLHAITDCGPDVDCEECDVCRYLNFLEWAGSVGKPENSTIERNTEIEAYLRATYPGIKI
jgi:hypothetical protein